MSLVTSKAVSDIISSLKHGARAICNEAAMHSSYDDSETGALAESIRETMIDMYSDDMGTAFHDFVVEDASNAAKMFKNGIADMKSMNLVESASAPDIKSLTVSIATTMRSPYEVNLHRLAHVEVADSWTFSIEDIEPYITAPGHKEENMIDALSPFAPVPFVDKTETEIETLTKGLKPGAECNNIPLTTSLDPLIKINRDCRIIGIDAKYTAKAGADGTAIPRDKIIPRRGATPYFSATKETMTMDYDVTLPNGEITHLTVNSKIDFSRNTMNYLSVVDNEYVTVEKVYFYATASHEEHLSPITTNVRNSFTEYMIPTRPHIEISMPGETHTDISKSVSHFGAGGEDVLAYLTSRAVVISTSMEEERLQKQICGDHIWEAAFPFEAPNYFSLGNIEWFKREAIPFLDSIATKMMITYNLTDCHFRVAVSPEVMKLLDTDFTIDKGADESHGGSGKIGYTMGIKTSTAKFYFIPTLRVKSNQAIIIMHPNEFKNAQLRTVAYFKYSSFVTDKLRRADNPRFDALTYVERNLPLTFTPAITHLEVTDMPIEKQTGSIFMRKVANDRSGALIDGR